MSGTVFANTLRTSWKQVLYWGLGLGVLGFYIDFIASSSDIIQGYADLFASMPPAMLQAFGASSVELLRTSEGWIVSIFVSEAAIFLSVFAVMAGMNISANDEQSGIMDVVMSLPISRAAYILERWIGYAAIGLGILVVCLAITLFGLVAFGVDAQMDLVFMSILNLYPGTLLVMTVTGLLAVIVRRRALAIGLSAVIRRSQLRFQFDRRRRQRRHRRSHARAVLFQLYSGGGDCAGQLRSLKYLAPARSSSGRIRAFRPHVYQPRHWRLGVRTMIGSVFLETLKQTWKQTVYWGVGLAAMALLVVLMVPLFDMQDMKELLGSFPPIILAMIGIGKELDIFATNEGFVAMGFFGKSALIFAVYPVVMGMRITANEEDAGTMDVLLSLPVQRARVIVEKFIAYGVSIVGVVVLIYLGMHLGVLLAGIDLDVARLAEITFYLIPMMVFIMAATMLVAVIVRRRAVALGIVTAFVIASYMLQAIGAVAEGTVAEPIGSISFLTYYNAGDILTNGFIWPHIAGFVVVSAVLVLASLYQYERRDIAV